MQQPEARASGPVRVALVNDYEIVLRGLESMLRPFRDRVVVVELDIAHNPEHVVDVALFDTYGHPKLGHDRIAELARDPHVGAVAVYTWSVSPQRSDAARAAGARGVLAKSMPADALVDAILQIAEKD
ncbi:MAG: helix-turn-helix transcriptional regulator, partial [Actinomycetia bacterium]|nr:helix-turn-helix transcriptional regulator [Actinomycetes bacterium]